MITKLQKGLLWLFGAMFLVPEILFFNIPAFITLFMGFEIPTPFSLIFKDFSLSSFTFLSIIVIEFIGAFGLFIFSAKFNKKLLAIIFALIMICLFLIFAFIKAFSNANFIM